MQILTKSLLLAIALATTGVFFPHIALGAFTYTFQPPQTITVTMQNSGVQSWSPSAQMDFALGIKSGPTWATASVSQGLTSVVAEGNTFSPER